MRNPYYVVFNESDSGIKVVVSDTQPTNVPVGSLWIDLSKEPNRVYQLNSNNEWVEVEALHPNVYVGSEEPSDPFDGLIWYNTSDAKLYVYLNGAWQPISSGSSSSTSAIQYKADEKTIHLDTTTNTFSVLFNNDESQEPGYVWDNKRIQKEALVKALIFG